MPPSANCFKSPSFFSLSNLSFYRFCVLRFPDLRHDCAADSDWPCRISKRSLRHILFHQADMHYVEEKATISWCHLLETRDTYYTHIRGYFYTYGVFPHISFFGLLCFQSDSFAPQVLRLLFPQQHHRPALFSEWPANAD